MMVNSVQEHLGSSAGWIYLDDRERQEEWKTETDPAGFSVPLWQMAVRLVEDKQQRRVIGMDVRVPADSRPLTGAESFYPSI